MDLETLRYETEVGVARIILDCPPRNALNLQMARELMNAATICDEDAGIRAVLISGASGTFGSRGDLKEFALTGRVLSADEARKWGLVTRVVPDVELSDSASSLARELAAGPTESLGATKRLFHRGWTETLETQMELETRTLSDAARTSDAREGISAFLKKRHPEFSGR